MQSAKVVGAGVVRAGVSTGVRSRLAALLLLLAASAPPAARAQQGPGPLDWPATTEVQRPWTRWWWQGSAVDDAGITAALEAYLDAGLGGVEITPIYGVAGHEDEFIDFLSEAWVERLQHSLTEAERLGLGVDMATGTGWPFGGPMVSGEEAAQYVAHRTYRLSGGERLAEPIEMRQEPLLRAIGNRTPPPPVPALDGPGKAAPGHRAGAEPDAEPGSQPGAEPAATETAQDAVHPLRRAGRERGTLDDLVERIADNAHLQALALEQVRFPKPMPLVALVAYSDAGAAEILTDRVGPDGRLDWTAPAGDWTLHALFRGWHGKLVERAAPGGEGWVLDHFSAEAVDDYLGTFSDAFAGRDLTGLRAFFNDSYEVDDATGEADWTDGFLTEFEARRGYDLRLHLPALFAASDDEAGVGNAAGRDVGAADDVASRVLTDYRRTVSDLLLDHFTRRWDAWAEERGARVRNQAHGSPGNILDLYAASDIPETEGSDVLRFKFATSAANVTGKPLAAAEAATWLDEHFLSGLGDVKAAVDRYFLGGVNHVVYHGTTYSPADAPWPGWLFYAAVHFQPTNPMWEDFSALNAYVTRAQSILQGGRPDSDVLVYLPIFDRYARRDPSLLVHFDGIEPFEGMTVAGDAALLLDRGYAFDFVSDRQLQAARVVGGQVAAAPGSTGSTGGTAQGARYQVVVVPGAELMPVATLEALVGLAEGGATLVFHRGLPRDVPGLADLDARRAAFRALIERLEAVGTDRVRVGDDLAALLDAAGVRRERLVEMPGLRFVRRARPDGTDWFVANTGDAEVVGPVPLAAGPSLAGAALFDPMTGTTGVASLVGAGTEQPAVYLQLGPGESVIVRGYDRPIAGPPFPHYEVAGPSYAVDGPWRIEFVEGGPALPDAVTTAALASWAELRSPGASSDAAAPATDAGTRDFSGTATYTVTFPGPAGIGGYWDLDMGGVSHWRLDLGDVRETARVRLNGRDLGTLIGPSYDVVIEDDLLHDTNTLEVDVSSLMANRIAAMDRAGEPWKRFYNVNFPANQRANVGPGGLFDASDWQPRPAGLLGPVTLTPVRAFTP